MTDSRLEVFSSLNQSYAADLIRITHVRIKGYRFFAKPIDFLLEGKNLLLYGENGTGKSSIYRALGLLAGKDLGKIASEVNVFAAEEAPEIEFSFSDDRTITFDSDSTEIPLGFEYLKPLALFMPFLDFKKLLRIHFSSTGAGQRINIYTMLRELFSKYPADDKGRKFNEIRNFPEYFTAFEAFLNHDLLPGINELIKIFDRDFLIEKFHFTTEIDNEGKPDPCISIIIDYRETQVEQYQNFLNEAKLSALSISLYFASIRRILEKTAATPCKILVLDDLLISMDISNRLKLLEILKTKFNDFQVFFFTHDKELFELYREKMDWAAFELYMDDSGEIPGAILKQGSTEIERAKESFGRKEMDACAFHLRKGFEELVKKNLSPAERRNKNFEELDLAGQTSRLISKSSGQIEEILSRLDSDRKHILNPLCHDDSRPVHSQELRAIIEDLDTLATLLRR